MDQTHLVQIRNVKTESEPKKKLKMKELEYQLSVNDVNESQNFQL